MILGGRVGKYNLGRGLQESNSISDIIIGVLCYNQTMKRELVDILACPVCKEKLELKVEAEDGEEIITGSLHCGRCNVDYPIVDGIPNLLPPEKD